MSEVNPEVNRVANALQYAMKLEMDGYDFYMEKSKEFANPTTEKIFVELAEEEKAHYEFLKSELENYVDNPKEYTMNPDFLNPEESVFEKRAESQKLDITLKESDVPDLTVLRMAYLVEADTAEFYAAQAEQAESENIKGVFTMLSEWERGHEKMFRDEYNRLLKEYMSMPWG